MNIDGQNQVYSKTDTDNTTSITTSMDCGYRCIIPSAKIVGLLGENMGQVTDAVSHKYIVSGGIYVHTLHVPHKILTGCYIYIYFKHLSLCARLHSVIYTLKDAGYRSSTYDSAT